MPLAHHVTSLDDPRLTLYRSLRERDLRAEGVFVTEGALLAERLLHSRFPVESILTTPANDARFAEMLQDRAPLYVAEPALLRQIVGFDFHRGVLAIGRRLPFPTVADLAEQPRPLQLVACPETETGENLGLIVRSAAAFGIDGLLLPEDGADPLSRRCLRQSMGSALSLPIARSANLLGELASLRRTASLQLVAAVASEEGAIPLQQFDWPERAVLAVGNEFHGLGADWLGECDHKVTIPLAPGCDSLNVAVATGVLLHAMSAGRAPS